MKKIFIFLLITILFIIPQTIFSQAQLQGDNDKELLNYGIQFTSPLNWEKIKLRTVSTAVFFLAPDKKASILISFPQVVSKSSFLVSLSLFRANKKPIKEEKVIISGVEAYVFTMLQVNGKGNTIKTKDCQLYKNSKIYMVDFISTDIDFNKYLPEFEKALNTFNVL